MYKKRMIIAIIMAVCLMTACAQKPESEERGGIRGAAADSGEQGDRVAAGGSMYRESRTEGDGAVILPDDTGSSWEASEILDACKGVRIEQAIEAAGGTSLLINADVIVEGIIRVSRYEYILTDITEEIRTELFKAVFPETAEKAEYDERNNVWTLSIDPAIRNYFLYLISYSNGGATIPGEQIIVFENRYYDLYPFEDNRLGSVSHLDSRLNVSLDEAEGVCRQVVDSITDTGDYAVDFIHAYGNNGRRPCLKLVFKRMLDGMPVTAYNDLAFLFDKNGIERVSGSLFSVKDIGLDTKLLSPEEAVSKLREQAVFLNFDGDNQAAVTEIALEYVVVMSPDGKILVTPVWRFRLGEDEDERNFLRQKILGIDAITGELIWEERGHTM